MELLMTFSIQRATSDGTLSTLDLTIEYIDQIDVHLFVDDVEMDLTGGTTPYTWEWVTPSQIKILPVVPNGSVVMLRRRTQSSEMYHNFDEGAVFKDESVDENFKQVLFLTQESQEGLALTDLFNDLDMHGFNINNLPLATEPTQPVTLEQLNAYAADSAAVLRTELLSTTGADIVFRGPYSVADLTGDKYVLRGGATLADLVQGIATGLEVVIPAGVNIVIDNTSGVGLTIPENGVRITGKGSLTALGDANDMIRSTGADFWIDGVTLQGPGTYRPDLGSAGEPPALLQLRGDDAVVEDCKFINPYGAGVFVRGAAGARVLHNDFSSGYAGSIAQPFLFQVYLRVASTPLVHGNTIIGSIQGICGGGDGSGTITVTGKDGLVTSNLDGAMIVGNTCLKQLDHSIYISNDSVQTTIADNQCESENAPLKFEGAANVVTSNRIVGVSGGIVARNPSNSVVDSNIVITTGSSAFLYGLLCADQFFKRPLSGLTISNNTFTHTGGDSQSGILVQGAVWDGYQSVISNLRIEGNTVTGYGAVSEGVGIAVDQRFFPGSPITGVNGSRVSISNNIINMAASAFANYGINLLYGLNHGIVAGNVISGVRNSGVRLLGVNYFSINGNTISDAGVPIFGVYEQPDDLTLHKSSRNNLMVGNVFSGTYNATVLPASSSCDMRDFKSVVIDTVAAAFTLYSYNFFEHYVYTAATVGAVATLDTAIPWFVGRTVKISNSGGNVMTVNPGGHTLAAGASLSLSTITGTTFAVSR